MVRLNPCAKLPETGPRRRLSVKLALTCGAPPPIVHSVALPARHSGWPTGTKLLLRCEDGYSSIGELDIQCQPNQKWSPARGHCQKISCTRPVVKGASTKSHKRRFYRGDRLVLRCQSGGPSSTLVCQSSGKWAGSMPVCDQDQCQKSCQNAGSCTAGNKCICPPGYSGRYCQHAVCDVACLNGGRCIAPNTCHCLNGTEGSNCGKISEDRS